MKCRKTCRKASRRAESTSIRNGLVWVSLSGSRRLCELRPKKCKVLKGPPSIDGQQCAEGWTYYPLTVGPNMKGTQHQRRLPLLQLGRPVQHIRPRRESAHHDRNDSDSLLVLKPETKEWITLRVPYPLGFYSRGLDGRIDDPNAGWKGRGLWANTARTPLAYRGRSWNKEQDHPLPDAAGSAGAKVEERPGFIQALGAPSLRLYIAHFRSRALMSTYAASTSWARAAESTSRPGRSFTWRPRLPVPSSKRAGSFSNAPKKKPTLT